MNDGTSSVAASNWNSNYAVNSNEPELSYSLFDRPHKVAAVAAYTSPVYAGGRLRTTVSLTYNGISGQRYSYSLSEGRNMNFNGDGRYGNSLMYIHHSDLPVRGAGGIHHKRLLFEVEVPGGAAGHILTGA